MKKKWVDELYKFLEEDNLKLHPVAEIFPKVSDNEIEILLNDIKTKGQLENIDRIGDMIIDGTHRYYVCKKLGIKPKFNELTLKSISELDYVFSKNYVGRKLNSIQCIDVAVKSFMLEQQTNTNTELIKKLKIEQKSNLQIQKVIAVREINAKRKFAKKFGMSNRKFEQGLEILEKAKNNPIIVEFWEKAKEKNLPIDHVYNKTIKPENSEKKNKKPNVSGEIKELQEINSDLKEKIYILKEQHKFVQDKYNTLLQNLKAIFKEINVNSRNLETNERFSTLLDKLKELIFKKKKITFPTVADLRKAELKLN